MLKPFIRRPGCSAPQRTRERGVTMALVALALVGIIAMAALSIDVGTLYQASAEAQRSADAAALAAARVLSLSGITGDPSNSSGVWSNACNAAVQVATSVGGQNNVGGVPPTVTVTFSATDGSGCTSSGGAFGVNPMVTVKVANATLPTFFAHVFGLFNSNWSTTSVSGTATAEVYNPSNSGSFTASTEMVPVQPRCVKPLIVPNQDPGNVAAGCTGGIGGSCLAFVNLTAGVTEGTIATPGIRIGGAGLGIIGRTFSLLADCTTTTSPCVLSNNPPQGNVLPLLSQPNLQYVPGQLSPGAPIAVPSCASATPFQQAIAGCDQSTVYHCGVPAASLTFNANEVDLLENPSGPAGDTASATQCLIREAGAGAISGQDQLVTTSFPYQITAGSSNPLGAGGDITSSNSIITIPIYDSTAALGTTGLQPVTIVGFLQVFVNQVNADAVGSLNVTVLNVAGCGNGSSTAAPFVTGSSPVPIRLITPP